MHLHQPKLIEKLRLSRFSAVEDGMHVEVSVFSPNLQEVTRILLTFREDEQLGLQAVLHWPEEDIVMPLEELKRAIRYAEDEVHTESYYDQPRLKHGA